MLKIRGQSYLYRRGESFVFRRAIPADARHAFDGKAEIFETLRAKNLPDARVELLSRVNAFEGVLRRIRIAARNREDEEPISLTDIEAAVRAWFENRQSRKARSEGAILDKAHRSDRLQELEQYGEDARAVIRGDHSSALLSKWIAKEIAKSNGWSIEPSSQEFTLLVRVVGRGQLEASRRELEDLEGLPRSTGDLTFTPEAYTRDAIRADRKRYKVKISELFEGYVAERKPCPATIKSFRQKINSLIAFLGHDDASKVQAKDIVDWKDFLLARSNGKGGSLSPKTVNDTYLSIVRTVFRWGVENDRVKHDPSSLVKVRAQSRQVTRSKGLTDKEAALILAAARKPARSRISPERAFARRWVPWICAYTGARVNEITQMRAEDVFKEDGVSVVRITPDAGSVKNHKARLVPLHPHLIEQGFLEAVRNRSGPLFYDPARYRGGSEANPQSKKVGEFLAKWVRQLGVDHPEIQPNHGWRHRFKTVARNCEMSPEIRDAIQGHVPRTEGEAYGEFQPSAMLRELIKLPRYD